MHGPLRYSLIAAAATAAAGAVAVVVWPVAAATVAVTNPGFESGLTGWSCTSAVSTDTGRSNGGTGALLGTPTGDDNAECTQSVRVTPGASYTLSAFVNGAYVFLGVTGDGGVAASTWTPGTGGSYQRLATTFSTNDRTTSVTISINGWYAQGAYHADDVTLTGSGDAPTTAPASASPTSKPPTTTPSASVNPSPSKSANPTTSPGATPSPGGSGPGASLAACEHFSDVVPPQRTVGPNRDSATRGPRLDLSGRLPAPGNVRGTLANGTVTISFDRVPGAVGYRVWRNGQSVRRIEDWGQASLSITDTAPCRRAYYTVAAMRSDDGDASVGQLSQPYRLNDDGGVTASPLAAGTTFTFRVTSYNDAGQTGSGYGAGLGVCAVDARVIPWGTRLRVDGYGECYAADIGTWIQGEIVDVWLPGSEADAWGVQRRTITVVP